MLTKIHLPKVKKGDIIDIIAPAGATLPFPREEIIDFFASVGLVARIPTNIVGGDHLFCAQEDNIREKLLLEALTATDSSVLWAFRGGYGTGNILSNLHKYKKNMQPKWVIGFSDITVLHIWIHNNLNWPTLHGDVVKGILANKNPKKKFNDIWKIISGTRKHIEYGPLSSLNNKAENTNKITGAVKGGNLSLVQTTLGTDWQINLQDSILLIEDVNEEAYRIDRMLHHLLYSKVLHGVKAIIFGDFNHKNKKLELLIKKTIQVFTNELNIPAFSLHGIGHKATNKPLLLNTNAYIENGKINIINAT